METINNTPGNQVNETFSLNIVIVGGGRNVLLEIIRLKPKGVGVLEYNISRILRNLLNTNQRLKLTEKKLVAERSFSNLLIQQSTAAIVIINTDFIILDVNDAYLNTVKKTKDKVIGFHCYEISHGIPGYHGRNYYRLRFH